MALPRSKEELSDWIKRELGEPVIRINVSQDQIDDAIDSAMEYWQEYNEAGQERKYIYKIIAQTDIDAGYFKLPDMVQAVFNVLNPNQAGLIGSSSESLFDFSYQFMSSNIGSLTGTGQGGIGALSDFYIMRQYQTELGRMFAPPPNFRYRYNMQKCYVDFISQYYSVGDLIVFDVQAFIDPDIYERVWTNRYLRNLAVAYTKKKWGNNLSKFTNINLPSGLTLNGSQILGDAMLDIEKAEQDIMGTMEPTGFIVG